MWKGNNNQISAKQFYLIIRMVEADSILIKSDFKNLESKRAEFTSDILDSLIRQGEFKHKQSGQIAKAYLKEYPFLKAIQSYDRDDLALAISNHYYTKLVGVDILHITQMTACEAVSVAQAMLIDFNPTSKRMDGTEELGEFTKYAGKPGTFFNAVETRRSFQHQTLYKRPFDESERYALLGLDKPLMAQPEAISDVPEHTPEQTVVETGIELETVEPDAFEADDWGYEDSDESNHEDQDYLDGALPDDSDKDDEYEEIDDDDLNRYI